MKPTYCSCLYYLLASFCLVSCNPGMYVPASQNVQLFQQKGEARIMIGQTTVQSAVAVGSHIGVAMNAQYINESSRKFMMPRGWPHTKQARLELAGGYFTQQKTSRSPILELYAGGGFGVASYAVRNVWVKQPATPYTLYDLAIPSQNWNAFIQPAIGFRSKRSSIVLSAKVNYLGFANAAIELNPSDSQLTNGPNTTYEDVAQFEKLTQLLDSHCLFLEPALTASTGGNRLKVMIQVFSWLTIINPSQYGVISSRQTFARLGLVLNVNQKLKKQVTD